MKTIIHNRLNNAKISLYSVKESFQSNDNEISSKVSRSINGQFAQIEGNVFAVGHHEEKPPGGVFRCNKGSRESKLDGPQSQFLQILKPILFMVLVFLVSMNTFSQNYSQGYLYVQVLDPIALPAEGEDYSNSTELNQLFDDYDVVEYSQSFPGAINEELQITYELHFNGELSEFYNNLSSTNFFGRIDSSDYYRAGCNNPKQISETFPSPLNDDHLNLLDVYCAWAVTEGSEDITIGVVDTYFEPTHEDMTGQITNVWGTSGDPNCDSHGVAVAGVAGANVNNGIGIAGVGYNTKYRGYMFESVYTGPCSGDPWDGIWQAYQDGCDIINISWGGIGSYPQVAAVQEIVDNGTILVLAAGNGDAVPGKPHHELYANIPGVINVSGVTANNEYYPTGHANHQYVDVAAMSTNVATTDINSSYSLYDGTSFAAPQVSGIAALILSINPCLEPGEVEHIIKTTADIIDDDYQLTFGFGKANAYQAVLKAMSYPQSHAPIISNITWNTEEYVSGELTIKPGATLTITGNVRLDQNAKIVVEPGAKLVIDGGHLTANPDCGNLFWQGIEVQGDPTESQRPKTPNGYYEFQGEVVIQNGGTIEDAAIGISMRTETGAKKGGGILTANDANFINNVVSVEMNPYTDVHVFSNGNTVDLGDKTRIEHSTFKTTDDFLLNSKNVRHVKLNGVNAIKMRGNTFVNVNSTLGTPGYGDKGIAIDASNSSFSLVAKYAPFLPGGKHKNTFDNLLYGVRASGFSNAGNITIRGNEFTDVYRSIYLNNTLSATVMHNTMIIPEYDDNMFPPSPGSDNAPYGIYVDGGEGFKVEENELKEYEPYSQTYGIIVNNTGAYNNEIYNNTFELLNVAMLAQNINRGTVSPTSSPDIGLKFICNNMSFNRNWDIKVVGQADTTPNIQGIGIARNQAVSVFEDGDVEHYPVRNIFSDGGSTNFYFDFHNDNAERLYYRYYKYATEKEEPVDYINITLIDDDDPHGCPSKDHIAQGLTIDDFYTQLSAAQVALNSSRLILNIWENGGDADLDEEVETTAPWEVYEEFNALMAESPYLSEDVIIAVIENQSFTDLMVKLLIVANPHVIESDEVMDALYDREPPMPESYIDEILDEEGTISQLTLLRSDVAADYHLVRDIGESIKRNYRRDTVNDHALDSLIAFVSRQDELTDRYELAGIYLKNEMFDDMQNCLDNIPSQFELSDQEYDDHQNYQDLYTIAENLVAGGSYIDQLDDGEVSLLNTIADLNRPGISQMAVAMLKANNPDDFFWHEVILNPDPEGEKSGEGHKSDKEKYDNISGEELSIYPNPAFSFVTVAYDVDESLCKQLSVIIHGSDGNKVIDQNLDGYANEVIVDLTKLSSGIYTVSLMGDGQRIATKKLNLLD